MTACRGSTFRRGFTLVELLVVVAILALLIGILIPALSGARTAARQTYALSGAKQLMLAHQFYQEDHRGQVPFGYAPPVVDGQPLEVTLGSGHTFPGSGSPLMVMRYPLRLATYLDEIWELLYLHEHADEVPEAPTAGSSFEDAADSAYRISTNPTFGINSVYIGGDLEFNGFIGAGFDRKPNRDGPIVFRRSQVRHASRLIVFGESQIQTPGDQVDGTGYHRVTPPRAWGHHWQAEAGQVKRVDPNRILGMPTGRWGDTVTVMFDGHAESLSADQLDDMTRWSDHAESPTDDVIANH